jgi:hypothetical protein
MNRENPSIALQLELALAAIDRVSLELDSSYRILQDKVSTLTDEPAQSRQLRFE